MPPRRFKVGDTVRIVVDIYRDQLEPALNFNGSKGVIVSVGGTFDYELRVTALGETFTVLAYHSEVVKTE